MFSYSGPFKHIACPGGADCKLLNCIFSHEGLVHNVPPSGPVQSTTPLSVRTGESEEVKSPARKRQRRSTSPVHSSRVQDETSKLSHQENTSIQPSNLSQRATQQDALQPGAAVRTKTTPENAPKEASSAERAVSPPPLKDPNRLVNEKTDAAPANGRASLKRKRAERKSESLAPRIVPKPPATHAMRLKLVTLMHEQMDRLNKEITKSSDPWKEALALTPQELIHLVLDEEERTARANASVYANVLKLRIAALKKMKIEAWKAARIKQIEDDHPDRAKQQTKEVKVSTGLTDDEEIAMLQSLITPQEGLAKHGYITSEIGAKAMEEARKGVEASHGYEVCDRCGSRFQVFPGRREDGALTTGGACVYHPGKVRRAAREAGDSSQPEKYTCCQSLLGSTGCATAPNHVYKTSDPARLALVLPFQRTPTQGSDASKTAVCFDCEMGYTTMGMELIRLTATSWPGENELIDVLVRPLGEILDLNSAFSGVWPNQFMEALPYDLQVAEGQSEVPGKDGSKLRIVSSPSAARDLLFDHLTTTTPLMGHALENDLNAVRIIHPTIIDTVLLYPHPRGLPIRYGLKYLVKTHLEKDIQMGGALGHDSKEDARSAGELIRLSVKKKWDSMRKQGWTVRNGDFVPPKPK